MITKGEKKGMFQKGKKKESLADLSMFGIQVKNSQTLARKGSSHSPFTAFEDFLQTGRRKTPLRLKREEAAAAV